MKEHDLKPPKGAHKSRKRVGRGNGSGHGTYSGRGGKGQTARSGGKIPEWFEGGQMPLQRRVPKRGFSNSRFRVENQVVNLERIEALTGVDALTVDRMAELGWIDPDGGPVKVLGKGTLTRAVTVEADRFSDAARQAILAAGGSVQVREGRRGAAESVPEAATKAPKAEAAAEPAPEGEVAEATDAEETEETPEEGESE